MKNGKRLLISYRDILELEVLFSNEWFVEFAISDTARLSVADERRASIKSNHGKGITLTFEVKDLEETFDEIEEKGLNPSPIKKHSWNASVFYIYDPEGHRIEFWVNSAF